MRLLHTSDWHLGQTLHDFDRGDEHQRFLNWLLDALEAEQIDALLIAGDIFDNPNPSADAQKQFYHFLTEAKRRMPHLDIVIIAGNHDSAGRLEAPASLLQVLGVTVVGCARTASRRPGTGSTDYAAPQPAGRHRRLVPGDSLPAPRRCP